MPLAVIEAKANKHEIGEGMQQALGYARTCWTFPSSSPSAYFISMIKRQPARLERELPTNSQRLMKAKYRLCGKGTTAAQMPIVTQIITTTEAKSGCATPASGHQQTRWRLCLTGKTDCLRSWRQELGKTLTAFHIIWRLCRSGVKNASCSRRPKRPC